MEEHVGTSVFFARWTMGLVGKPAKCTLLTIKSLINPPYRRYRLRFVKFL